MKHSDEQGAKFNHSKPMGYSDLQESMENLGWRANCSLRRSKTLVAGTQLACGSKAARATLNLEADSRYDVPLPERFKLLK
jgi:hypothetical protein